MNGQHYFKIIRKPKIVFDYIKRRIGKFIVYWIDDRNLMYETTVHGPDERLIIKEKNLHKPMLVNTRSGKVIIQNDVILGHHVSLITGFHDYYKKGTDGRPTITDAERDIIIREGAWVASNCTVVGPCTIGKNSVVAAGSVVVNSVKPGYLYGGNPAVAIKKIDFD